MMGWLLVKRIIINWGPLFWVITHLKRPSQKNEGKNVNRFSNFLCCQKSAFQSWKKREGNDFSWKVTAVIWTIENCTARPSGGAIMNSFLNKKILNIWWIKNCNTKFLSNSKWKNKVVITKSENSRYLNENQNLSHRIRTRARFWFWKRNHVTRDYKFESTKKNRNENKAVIKRFKNSRNFIIRNSANIRKTRNSRIFIEGLRFRQDPKKWKIKTWDNFIIQSFPNLILNTGMKINWKKLHTY